MNTKFPTNGRYTTLGDIIHEYAAYSPWPTFKPVKKYDYGWDTGTTKSQPFFRFLFSEDITSNNTYMPLNPYEIVWFDNIYSTTEKDETNKIMKIILQQDSSDYSFNRPIIASTVQSYDTLIKPGNFPFRFIIPTKKGDGYYYNYKTTDGEAVVMYALLNIIDSIYNYTGLIGTVTKFLFGEVRGEKDGHANMMLTESSCKIAFKFQIKDETGAIVYYGYETGISLGTDSYDPEINVCIHASCSKFFEDEYTFATITCDNNTHTSLEGTNVLFKDTWEKSYIGMILYNDLEFKGAKEGDFWNPTNDTNNTYVSIVSGATLIIDPTADLDGKYDIVGAASLFKLNDSIKEKIFTITDKKIEVKSDAYLYLGEMSWTYQYVLFYTYADYFLEKNTNNKFDDAAIERAPGPLGSFDNNNTALLDYIKETLSSILGVNYTENDYDYKYRDNLIIDSNKSKSIPYKVIYFILLYLLSQRYFTSYVTAFEFQKISNKSYAVNEPVLRCDLGILQIIESFTVESAEHDWRTALPQGPLTMDTSFYINVSYKIKYVNLPEDVTPSTYAFKVTYQDLLDTVGNDESDYKWFMVVDTPNAMMLLDFSTPASDSSKWKWAFNASAYFTDKTTVIFPLAEPKWNDEYNIPHGVSDCSLGTFMWPVNDDTLKLADESQLKQAINNPYFNNNNGFADTCSIYTFLTSETEDPNNGYSRYKSATAVDSSNISPFCKLRIHNVFKDSGESADNSSYYIDVSIYRCKNYYYVSDIATTNEANKVNFTYEPTYLSSSPNTTLATFLKTVAEVGEVEAGNYTDKEDDVSKWFNAFPTKYFTINLIYGEEQFYVSLQSNKGKYNIFASGAKLLKPDSIEESVYNTDKDISIYYLNNNYWIEDTASKVIKSSASGTGNEATIDLYQIVLDANNSGKKRSARYWKLRFSDTDTYYYFKMTTNKERIYTYSSPTDVVHVSSIYIMPLFATDAEESTQETVEYNIIGSIEKDKFHLCFLLFNPTNVTLYYNDTDGNLLYDDNNLNYVELAFDVGQIDRLVNYTNLYIKPTAIKRNVTNGTLTSRYFYLYNGTNNFHISWQLNKKTETKYNWYLFGKSDLFGSPGINITNLITTSVPELYIAVEPIYIIELDEITRPNDAPGNTLFNSVELKLITYTGTRNTVNNVGLASKKVFIRSFCTEKVYLTQTDIQIDGTNLYDWVKTNAEKYDFEISMEYKYEENGTLKSHTPKSIININQDLAGLNIDLADMIFLPDKHNMITIILSNVKDKEESSGKARLIIYLELDDSLLINITNIKPPTGLTVSPSDYSTTGGTFPINTTLTIEYKGSDVTVGEVEALKWIGFYDTEELRIFNTKSYTVTLTKESRTIIGKLQRVSINQINNQTTPVTKYTISVKSDGTGTGTVTVNGSSSIEAEKGDNILLVATPGTDSEFTKWNDGDTNSTRSITVSGSYTYTATFTKKTTTNPTT